ncbi:MAG: bacillithiol system redox-active protein YtxJ [Chitinophagaceae bacterium]
MNWINITTADQLDDIRQRSNTKPQVIFKHSIRCSISSMAKARLERSSQPENVDFYYLDLINYRTISNKLSELFDVWHESPQVLVIKNGRCVYDQSHTAIRMEEILKQAI